MAVAAQPVNFDTETASGSVVHAVGWTTGWHVHDRHQLACPIDGPLEVETEGDHHRVAAGRAILIPAALPHRTTFADEVRTISVYLDPGELELLIGEARILTLTPLLRELVIVSDRWPIERPAQTETDEAFFHTLAHFVSCALDDDAPIVLPAATQPDVAEAMAYTRAHLAATATEVARAVGMSERTLRRGFAATGLSWRSYQSLARLQRARDLLADDGVSVLEIARRVGYESASSFARAFAATCGESPAAYRRRISARCRGA
jgi:AraC-like DNA-binding protein